MSRFVANFMRAKRYSLDLKQHNIADMLKIKRSNYARYELDGEMRLSVFLKFLIVTNTPLKDFEVYLNQYRRDFYEQSDKKIHACEEIRNGILSKDNGPDLKNQ